MNACCGDPVYQVTVGNRMITVDAQPHPAGIIAIRTVVNGWHYGYNVRRDEHLRDASHTRHRLHRHQKGD